MTTGPLCVLYEDARWLVVDKPAGLAVHSGRARERDTVASRILALGFQAAHLAHRLDAGTSGALVLAKDRDAARQVGACFAAGEIEKRYLAWVRGMPPERATVDHPVPKDEGGARVDAVTEIARLATIMVEASTLRERRYSLVLARPLTGRFHQIRRHLKHLGCPLLGDANYGKSEHNRLAAAQLGLSRLGLHAWRVSLAAVGGPEWVEAPLPSDMLAPLHAVGVEIPVWLDAFAA